MLCGSRCSRYLIAVVAIPALTVQRYWCPRVTLHSNRTIMRGLSSIARMISTIPGHHRPLPRCMTQIQTGEPGFSLYTSVRSTSCYLLLDTIFMEARSVIKRAWAIQPSFTLPFATRFNRYRTCLLGRTSDFRPPRLPRFLDLNQRYQSQRPIVGNDRLSIRNVIKFDIRFPQFCIKSR